MGLDQYLIAKKYASPDFFSPDIYESVIDAVNARSFVSDRAGLEVAVKVGYWRKANQIHGWFVHNVQRGEDDCKEYYVDREQLEALRSLCENILADKADAYDSLPTIGGFFFGSTDYDEYYFSELQNTVNLISHVLDTVPNDWDFYYWSSW